MDIECDEAATLQFTLPGGGQSEFDTEADGTFMGVVGGAYICNTASASVAVLGATDAGDQWTGLIEITQPAQAPAGSPPPGAVCDVLLHPEFNYVTYQGAIVAPSVAFGDAQFSAVMPTGDDESLQGSEQVLAVFEFAPLKSGLPTEWGFREWRPGAPDFVNTIDLMVPGHTYIVLTTAELAWTFPEAAATP
ncbi:MAG: hypothetical protein GEU80_09825 [Dehalococcoidia bacterium]|nr:hypothetical protein [Dehalococcoidia bacterium]